MRISETLELSIPDDIDVNKLERYLVREIKRFGKQVFGKVLQEIETKKLKEAKGKVGCREKVPRYLFTRLGLIRFERHKVKYKEKGKFGFFLDDVLGLRPYQSATRWVKQCALELAVEYPFRKAMSLLRHEIGDEISHRTIHRWAQEEGKKLREEEEARQEAIFGRAEKVRNDGKEREIVVLEVDGTMIHSQEKGEDDFEAKLGIMYSGKELESKLGTKEVLVVGSGGIEKNIDLMLCRRFKGRGMSWSRAGAQNLLKLRLLRYDRKDWNAYWRRRVN